MNDLAAEMERIVEEFVEQITSLATRAAVDALRTAVGHEPQRGMSIRQMYSRRGTEAIERVGATFRSYVKRHPGQNIESISRNLGLTSAELKLPVQKLVRAGLIKTRGNKRATKYYSA